MERLFAHLLRGACPSFGRAWLNLVEGFFSKLARSVLRYIRVSSIQELRDRIMAAIDFFNRDPALLLEEIGQFVLSH
jgi:hypothetical protein